MIKKMIENYIKNLTKKHINEFATKNNIFLNNNELNLIYKQIKENWYTIIYKDPTPIFQNIKENINTDTYQKIITLYYSFYEKYKNYL